MSEGYFKRNYAWLILVALAAVLACAGYWLLFTTFMIYDDEGYVLLSLKNFSRHGRLYDQVYTQYGPFPYLLYDALHRLLGFAYTNTTGRWITLINWLGTASACAALVARTTRSLLWSGFTLTATFLLLWVMINEPIHPGSLITAIVALTTWLGAEAWRAQRLGWFTALCGLTSAVLLLTKVNVGVFYTGAVVTWLVLNTASRSLRRPLLWLVGLGCAALPFALMWSLISEPWVRLLALVFAASSLGILLSAQRSSPAGVTVREWISLLVWSVAGVALLCALTLWRGTSVFGLVDGVILEPLKHPGVYFFPIKWRPGSGVLALLSLVAVACTAQLDLWDKPRFREIVAVIRVAAAGFCLLGSFGLTSTTVATWTLSYGLSLAWIFALPLTKGPQDTSIRAWIAVLLAFQSLQVYPVAGSQLNWGTFLWIPLLALGLYDALPILGELLGRAGSFCGKIAAATIAVLTLFMAGKLASIGRTYYYSSERLGLSGAENLRLPGDVTFALRIIVQNLRAHADMLFSFPGLYSANLWTGLPTPTLSNATHWFSLLSAARQQEIIARLAASPNAAMLVQRDVLQYLARSGFFPAGPLHAWLMSNFDRAASFGGYEIWVHRGRKIAVLSTASASGEQPDAIETLMLTLRDVTEPIARIDLCTTDQPTVPLTTFDAANAEVSITQIGLDGQSLAPKTPAHFPVVAHGVVGLSLKFKPIFVHGSFSRLLLVPRNEAGRALGEVLIAE